MKRAAIDINLMTPRPNQRRVGRPRDLWTEETVSRVYQEMMGEEYAPDTHNVMFSMYAGAHGREF